MWYNTSQLSLLLKECGVIKPLYRKKWNVILTCWFALNTYHMLRNEFPVYSSVSKDGEDLTSKKLTTTILFWKNIIWLKTFVHISQCPKPLNPLRNISECKAFFFLLLGNSRNQSPFLCSHGTKEVFVFLNTSSKVSLMWYQLLNYFVLMGSSTAPFMSRRCLNLPPCYTFPLAVETLPQLLTSGWRRLDGTPSWVQQRGCHPRSELRGDARHSLPSGSELATSSWKDLLLNDISLEWNTDHLSTVNDDICLLTSQDQHYKAWNLFSPLKWNYVKTKFTVNGWLLKPKAASARYLFC